MKVEVSKSMQVLRGRGLRHRLADAFATPVEDEEAAFAIALSARHFSRRTQSLVDDKLSFSATLMRAGEVGEANRAMAEFEHDVRDERAALLEQVSVVRATRGGRRGRRTRPLLLRLLATALLGMSLMFASVAGAAVAGFVADRLDSSSSVRQERIRGYAEPALRNKVRTVMVAPGVKAVLDNRQMRTYRQLLSGAPVTATDLEAFFDGLPPDVAAAVRQVLTATGLLSSDQVKMVDLLLQGAQAKKDGAQGRAAPESESAGQGAASDSQETETEEDSASRADDKSDGDKRASDDGGTQTSLPELPLPLPLP